MNIDLLKPEYSAHMLYFLHRLDAEAIYMNYRPGERSRIVKDFRSHVRSIKNNCIIAVAWNIPEGLESVDWRIIGYVSIYGGRQTRNAHVGNLACGVLLDWCGHGVADRLFDYAFSEAKKRGIRIIELSVVKENKIAYNKYIQWGFRVCGVRHNTFMMDDGTYHDELFMTRALYG
jgi:GNAT superfamily N-acetyltransferase